MKNKFVPDPVQQAEDQPQERPDDVEICFVPDTAVMTNLDACEDQPTGGCMKEDEDLKIEEKREVVKIFQDLLRVGRVPPKQIFNQRKIGNTTLRTVQYENAVGYRQQKSKMNLTSADKCKSWLQTGQIHNVAASTTSSSGARQYWTELQGELVKKATLTCLTVQRQVTFSEQCLHSAANSGQFQELVKEETIIVNIFL